MARGSLVNLAAMVGGAALSFALVVLVSRWLQPGGAGAFFELIALFTILSNTFELGADTGLTRWISRARAVGGLADLRWIVGVAVIPVMLAGIAAAVAMWIAAPQIAGVFLRDLGPAAGATDIRLVAPLVPIAALSACLVDGSRGFGRMWPYLAIEGIGKPTARIVLVLAALVVGWGLRGAIVAWEIPIVIGLALGWIIFSRVMRKELSPAAGVPVRGRRRAVGGRPGSSDNRQPGKQPGKHGVASSSPVDEAAAESAKVARSQVRLTPELAATLEFPVIFEDVPRPAEVARRPQSGRRDQGRHRGALRLVDPRRRQLATDFWGFTGPRAFQATFQVVILWLDILLVGALVSTYAAGVYGAVSKLAIVGTFALEGNRLAIGPQLSALLARHQHDRAADLYQSATRWLMLASWPLYLVFAIFPAVVLGIFGAQYVSGAAALAVLSLAMLVNLGTGNVTVVLLMGGKSSWSALNAGLALAVNIALNLWLVPLIGILGAAIAWGASIVVDNVTAMIEVRWVLGLAPFGPGYGLVAAITVGCFGVTGVAVRALLGENLPALATALGVGAAVFAAALYLARVPLQLTGLAAAVRMRVVPTPASHPGEQAA